MSWQPIETAPRDGSWFLAYGDGEFVALNCPPHYSYAGRWHLINGRWEGHAVECMSTITHWMPLPPPPEGGQE